MKVLFIGNFLEATGWGLAGQDYILALDSVGIDVVPRPICMGGAKAEVPKRILDLMEKSSNDCNIVIQNVLPHLLRYDGNYKNYSLCFFECDNLSCSSWPDSLNLMDGCIVSTQHNKQTLLNSRVTKPIHIVPCPTDVTKYERAYERLPQIPPENYYFYTIGEFTRRKNVPAILRAFHTEFAPYENVGLVIKTTPTGLKNPQEEINKVLYDIKVGLKLHSRVEDYKQEIIICENWPEEMMGRLHNSCDCFVSVSHGEGWCRPAIDAMTYGLPVLAPAHSSFLDYLTDGKTGYTIPCYPEDAFGCLEGFADLYTAKQGYYNFSVRELRKKMREIYENRREAEKIGNRAWEYVRQHFTYEKLGEKLREILND